MTDQRLGRSWSWVAFTIAAWIGVVAAWLLEADISGFSLAYGAIVALPLCMQRNGRDLDFFRPYFCLVLLTYLYSVSTLMYVAEFGVTYYDEAVAAEDLRTYLAACLLTAAGLAAGFALASIWRQPRSVGPGFGRNDASLLLRAAFLLGLACSPLIATKFMPWAATSYADIALSLRIDRMQDQAAGLKEVFLESFPVVLIMAASTRLAWDQSKPIALRVIAAALILAYIATMALSGWRSHMMVGLLIVAVYFHYRVRPLRPGFVILAGVIVYVLINALSVARIASNPAEMFAALWSDVGDRGFAFLALQQSGELATSTNLLRLIQGLRVGESDFGWGLIALGQLAAFVPRILLPDRPDFASELFVKTFYPEIHEIGGGYGFFLPQDGYWDFGLAGVLLYAAAFAFATEVGYKWMRRRFRSDLFVFCYALLYSQLVLSVVRSGIFTSIKAALIAALPFILLIAMAWAVRRPVGSRVAPA